MTTVVHTKKGETISLFGLVFLLRFGSIQCKRICQDNERKSRKNGRARGVRHVYKNSSMKETLEEWKKENSKTLYPSFGSFKKPKESFYPSNVSWTAAVSMVPFFLSPPRVFVFPAR